MYEASVLKSNLHFKTLTDFFIIGTSVSIFFSNQTLGCLKANFGPLTKTQPYSPSIKKLGIVFFNPKVTRSDVTTLDPYPLPSASEEFIQETFPFGLKACYPTVPLSPNPSLKNGLNCYNRFWDPSQPAITAQFPPGLAAPLF